MKHTDLYISLAEWFAEDKQRTALHAVAELRKWLTERGYSGLEDIIKSALKEFIGVSVDQSIIKAVTSGSEQKRRSRERIPDLFVTCFKKNNAFFFLDTELVLISVDNENEAAKQPADLTYNLEIDIFAPNKESDESAKGQIIEEVMRCFGLTKSRESLLVASTSKRPFVPILRDRLTVCEPLGEELFQRLRDERERIILRELKRRGSILERDLHELRLDNIEPDRVKRALDYLSGEDCKLVERKYAIVCNDTQEIIFTLSSREGVDDAKNLECPKCYKKIGTETLMAYYKTTDELKKLLDGSRWMPLLVRDALINAGVSNEDIFTEVKNGEDEIDALVFHMRRILVMELKNRPVNLNDAYKLSAKTSRLESIINKADRESPDEDGSLYVTHGVIVRTGIPSIGKGAFIPIVITTHDVAKDARDLLQDTREDAQFLENCEGKIDTFIAGVIGKIDEGELKQRLYTLTAYESSDSVAKLAGAQIRYAFAMWLDAQSSA